MHYNPETHETIVGGLGERHLDVAMAVLKRKFGVQAELSKPRIAFRETLTAKAEGQGRHKKQTGGRGQFGDCWVRLSPMPRGEGYLFDNKIVGGVIPSKYIPAVDRGIQEASVRGVSAGSRSWTSGPRCTTDRPTRSTPTKWPFKMAGILAFKTVAPKCRPVILEPLDLLEIVVPEAYLGDVLGDISGRRGHILGTDSDGDRTTVRAVVPQSELHLYATQLYSLTHGHGTFTRRFNSYEQVPVDAVQKIIAENARETEEVEA